MSKLSSAPYFYISSFNTTSFICLFTASYDDNGIYNGKYSEELYAGEAGRAAAAYGEDNRFGNTVC